MDRYGKMNTPKISVVMPTYNRANYICESIDSILRQTFTEWELIIVDDCSTDDTLSIARHYEEIDNRIRVIHNETNKQLPESLNIGFRHARGKYLTWTSDDNWFLSRALEVMNEYLDRNDHYSMVCTGFLFVDDKKKFLYEALPYIEQDMYTGDVVGACFMYRREVLDQIGEYDTTLFCAEDYEYWLRMLYYGKKIGYIPGVFYLYRLHDASLAVGKADQVKEKNKRLYLKYLDWILNNIKESPTQLMLFYSIMLKYRDIEFDDINSKFSGICAPIIHDKEIPPGSNIILYGSGHIGGVIKNELSERVVYFADKDKNKWGTVKEGIIILSPQDMLRKLDEGGFHLVLSVGNDKMLDVMNELINIGVESFSVPAHVYRK